MSRSGDKSGTHAAELRFWKMANFDREKRRWLQRVWLRHGPGFEHRRMLQGAYVLADRATWLNFKNRADLADFGGG